MVPSPFSVVNAGSGRSVHHGGKHETALSWRAGTKNKTLSIDIAILRYERVDEAVTHCGICDGDQMRYRRTLAALLDRLSRNRGVV